MRDEVRRDWDWANQYWPQQRAIILHELALFVTDVRLGTEEEDLQFGTDAVIYTSRGSVGLRVRDAKWWQRDFSIRSWRASGVPTELDKWLAGNHPDWFLLGWARDTSTMDDWVLFDVARLIESKALDYADEIKNHDGVSAAKYVSVDKLETAGCVVARAPRLRAVREPIKPKIEPETQPRLF